VRRGIRTSSSSELTARSDAEARRVRDRPLPGPPRGRSQEVRLDKGDRLFLFSDGLNRLAWDPPVSGSHSRGSPPSFGPPGHLLSAIVEELDAEWWKWRGSETSTTMPRCC